MVTISITFYTMIKSSTPIFVLGWAYLFGIERITWSLVGVMFVIACGEFLTVAGEAEFVLNGFLMCLGASLLSGARWTLVQLKLQTIEPPIKSTIATMRLLAPSMFFTMAFTSLVIEKPWNKFQYDSTQDEDYDPSVAIDYAAQYRNELLKVLGLGAAGGCIAIMMILCEFYLILHSSAVILMIGGVIKEMITIMIGYVECKNPFLALPNCATTLRSHRSCFSCFNTFRFSVWCCQLLVDGTHPITFCEALQCLETS
jgi:solute carrier family 35, member C2